ncbi:nuclear transport factor 2 family protein [Pseudonocardia acaciae]|uniref:nuclear transport factor 2 family protein n=1 Tax=Pseudonocardia acaciae TaxID=551276 RepID=UPI0006873BBF|nr:nuclear transport factor 2 family protein [Pseudonocardia acaciae]
MSSTEEQVLEFGRRWADAEQRGDADALDAMATDDFTLVGPFGFLLDKSQWVHRYRSGALVTQELTWRDVTVREYGDTAVAVGVHAQRAAHQGRQNDGEFRSTHVLVRAADGWRLASMHLSRIATPPAS